MRLTFNLFVDFNQFTLLSKDSVLNTFHTQQKRIGVIAVAIFSLLAISYLIYRNWTRSQSVTTGQQLVSLSPKIKNDDFLKLDKAQELYDQDCFAAAAAHFKEFLDIYPQHLSALKGYADALRLLGDLDEAKGVFEGILKIDSHNGFALSGLAEVLSQQGNLQEATKTFLEALKIDSSDPFLLRAYAAHLHLQGELEESLEQFKKALEFKRENAFALSGYADVLREQGRLEEALEPFEAALKIAPQNVFALRGYADVLRQLGRKQEALERFKEALTIDSEDPFALEMFEKLLGEDEDNISFRSTELESDSSSENKLFNSSYAE